MFIDIDIHDNSKIVVQQKSSVKQFIIIVQLCSYFINNVSSISSEKKYT